jgi:hypothetical protein
MGTLMQATRAISLPHASRLPWQRSRDAIAAVRARLADPVTRPALLWRVATAPFWMWSDVPAPELPRRVAAAPHERGLAGDAVVGGIDRLRRRLWVSHAAAAVCRGVWLGIVIAILFMLVDIAGGPVFDPLPAAVAGGVLLLAGVVLAALCRPSRQCTARMLDRTFGLQERMTTALDDLGLGVPAPGERATVPYLQMADAANAIAALRGDRRLRPELPVREFVLIVLSALILTTLAFLRGLGGGLPELATARVPPFTPAVERPAAPEPSAADTEAATMAPTVEEVMQRSDRSAQARRDLQALATALADHALTRPAAEQIARGDYDSGSQQLREAASQASDLSQGAREGLASDLDHATSAMQPETTGLHEATRDAASGLRQGDEAARSEMRDLANAVENAGKQIVPQGELAAQMRSAQQAQAARGESGGESSAAPMDGDMSGAPSDLNSSDDPGSGADAEATDAGAQGDAQSGEQPGSQEGQSGQSGQTSGQAAVPGAAQQPGEGQGSQPGEASQPGAAGGPDSEGDSATANQGGGAGTGQSADEASERGEAASNIEVGAGAGPADPDVSTGGAAEADATALDGANERIALPASSGQDGVQTASDGGSALRGSGAGVTAGSGFATQGEVGEAGPDSNRVPPQHRETVERYFSSGSGE